MPTIYEQIKNAIGGGVNPNGGNPIRLKYRIDNGIRVYWVVPYVIGKSPDPDSTTIPPEQDDRFLCYKYRGPEQNAPNGWRCFKVDDITEVDPASNAPGTPRLDPDRQNCVVTPDPGPR